MRVEIVRAEAEDTQAIAEILAEAATWLEEKGMPLWTRDRIAAEKIQPDVKAGMFWLARANGEIAGCVRFQETDEEYWGDVPHEDSAFIHRLAIKRKFAGAGVSTALIEWAAGKAREMGKTFLRLDCGNRPSLRAVYEQRGFKFHSIKQKEPYPVARYELSLQK